MERGPIKASVQTLAAAADVVGPGADVGSVVMAPVSESHGILAGIDDYLARSTHWYERGEDEYYARLSLAQAAEAKRCGNYGIGAVVIMVAGDTIAEFRKGNAMVTGAGIIDHAETLAILAAGANGEPDDVYPRHVNARTSRLATGLHVFGTLEPCPMCACVATNARAVRSVSTVADGDPYFEGGHLIGSSGGATVLGAKASLQPAVWQGIQQGLGLTFELLDTKDIALRTFSKAVFSANREEIDQRLATRFSVAYTDRAFPGPSLG